MDEQKTWLEQIVKNWWKILSVIVMLGIVYYGWTMRSAIATSTCSVEAQNAFIQQGYDKALQTPVGQFAQTMYDKGKSDTIVQIWNTAMQTGSINLNVGTSTMILKK